MLRLSIISTLLACALAAPANAATPDRPVPPSTALRAHYAQAGPVEISDPAADPLIARWLEIGRAFWNASPNCPGGVSVTRAQWLPDAGVWAAAVRGGCAMALDPDFYPAPPGYDHGWWQAAMCTVVAHEWGHLLGNAHVSDPNNLMNPVAPINIVAGCPTWGLSTATLLPSQGNNASSAAKQKSKKASKRSRSSCSARSLKKRSKRTRAAKRCAAKRRAKRR
jgi:hypothetical protein